MATKVRWVGREPGVRRQERVKMQSNPRLALLELLIERLG